MKNSLLSFAALGTALASLFFAEEASAAPLAWSEISRNSAMGEKLYGISGTIDMAQTPPLLVGDKNATIEFTLITASDTVVAKALAGTPKLPYNVAATSATTVPSGTIAGLAPVSATATTGGYQKVTNKNSDFHSIGANIDISGTGALWQLFVKITTPLNKVYRPL